MLNYLAQVAALSAGALTVRAQTVNPNDDGMLLWPSMCPRTDVDSTDLTDVFAVENRIATDRREWNAKGRHVPVITPPQRNVSIVPVEGYARINEKEMQKLNEMAMGGTNRVNQQTLVNLIGARLPARVKSIAMGNFRRVELDFFESWVKGTITQRNPQNATQTYTASWAFATSRIQTAGTDWDDGSVNAWDEFIAWLQDGESYMGAIAGAMMRSPVLAAIRADAPTNLNGVKYSLSDLQKLVADELQSGEFTFFKNDRTVKVFTDGGDTTTDTYVFPAQYVAAIPASGVVGETAFAPVVRADDVEGFDDGGRGGIDLNEIDIRGNRVFYSKENNGKTAEVEVQVNALSIPNEQTLWTIDSGVA
jgi:hypothetical protein